MGYDQSTNLFYGTEIELGDGVWWDEFTELPQGDVWPHMTGSFASGEYQRYWLVVKESWIQLSAGKYETNDAVHISQLNLDMQDDIYDWNTKINKYLNDHGLVRKGTTGWVAAAHGS